MCVSDIESGRNRNEGSGGQVKVRALVRNADNAAWDTLSNGRWERPWQRCCSSNV